MSEMSISGEESNTAMEVQPELRRQNLIRQFKAIVVTSNSEEG
jgi:hypothetical protein